MRVSNNPLQRPYNPAAFEGFVGVVIEEPSERRVGFGEVEDIYPVQGLSDEQKLRLLSVHNCPVERRNALAALALIEAEIATGKTPLEVKRQLMKELHSDVSDNGEMNALGKHVLQAWNHREERFYDCLLGVSQA